jgi:1-acyl-sn-glycerol-3-phosphate acyltransferase
VRLLASSALPQALRTLRRTRELAYALYAWALFVLMGLPTYVATAVATSERHAWAINRAAARTFLKLAGIRFSVSGLENVPVGRTCVLVANHASYLDGLVLLAALPVHCAFVAKKELKRPRITRLYLTRLGAEFVERFEVRESVADAERLVRVVRDGRNTVFFPEGTFMTGAGLLPFHLGAFLTAVKSSACVVPVAIRGTRSVLRDDEWLPRCGEISVSIGPPIEPSASGADTTFSTAVRLRDGARSLILAECGEPDLATKVAG